MLEDVDNAVRVRRHGSFHVDLPPDQAIKLFTALGERLWVPGLSLIHI